MQNRYTGDVGDFGKFGLLRALCASGDGNSPLSLGIVWYLTSPTRREGFRNDGKHRSYLRKPERYRTCDPDLFDRLQVFEDPAWRAVAVIPSLIVLPPTTIFYPSPLSYDGMPRIGPGARDMRIKHRRRWFDAALERTRGANVLFLDPDNGLQVKSVRMHSDDGPKYVSCEEYSQFLRRDNQCLILYQHGRRQKELAARSLRRVAGMSNRDPFALLYRRGTQRVFLISPCMRHHSLLLDRAERFIKGKWKEHFEPQVFRC